MLWQTIKAYWKGITTIVIGGGALLGTLWAGSGFVFAMDDYKEDVDETIVLAQVADQKADQALEWQRLQMEREKMAAREERKKWRSILKLCMDGTIKDKKVCAEATAALK